MDSSGNGTSQRLRKLSAVKAHLLLVRPTSSKTEEIQSSSTACLFLVKLMLSVALDLTSEADVALYQFPAILLLILFVKANAIEVIAELV